MKFFIISLLCFISTYSVTAQNFQPFRNKYQYSYTGYIKSFALNSPTNSSLIHGIEVDSAKIIDSDSTFYFNRLSINTHDQTFIDNFWGNSMVKKLLYDVKF